VTKKLPICENCGSETGIRRILWGLPSSEPDFDEFVIGGCMPGENPPSLRCIDCGWENDHLGGNGSNWNLQRGLASFARYVTNGLLPKICLPTSPLIKVLSEDGISGRKSCE